MKHSDVPLPPVAKLLGLRLGELTCNFLRPVWRARLTATAKIVSRGRTIGLAEGKHDG